MIRTIIFDLDQTLIDRDSTMRHFLATQQERFPELSGNFISACIKFQKNGYADKLAAYEKACAAIGANSATLPAALYADLKDRYGFAATAFAGAIEVLSRLRRSYPLGLITNGRTRGQMAKTNSAGMTEYFSAIVISESHGAKKPHPSLFEACLEQLNSQPDESVYIGDNPVNDIAPANALGMHTIWMRNDNYASPTFCTAIADSILEIPELITMLNRKTAAEVSKLHEDNRLAWNEGAQYYTDNNQARVEKLKAGKSSLHAVERANLARFGPLDQWCQRAIHLQCASGGDTLSLILEGAHEAVGIDISDVHINNARWTTEQLAMPAHWYRCDVLDTPTELNSTANLVYTGRGALCWIHGLDAWAGVVARLLCKGGVFSVFDEHPASWLFAQDTTAIAASGIDYFAHSESNQGWADEYIGDLGKPESQHATKHERLWTLADIFQALVKAGLQVEHLGEHRDEYWCAFPKLSEQDKNKLPMTFSMIAVK